MISVAIVDDKSLLASALRKSIEHGGQFSVCQICYSGEQILDYLSHTPKSSQPDIVLMDVQMPGMGGVEATRRIKRDYPHIKVLMLSVHDGLRELHDSVAAGAGGYILKDEPRDKIQAAILEVLQGGAPMSSPMAIKALQIIREQGSQSSEVDDPGLTAREHELLKLLAQGLTYDQVADQLFISSGTVRKHVQNLYEKLEAHSKVEAINQARRRGILHS